MLPSYRSLDLGTIVHPKIVWVYEICWDRSMFISKPVQFYAEWPPYNFHDENSPGLPVQFLGFVCVDDSISMFHGSICLNPTFSCLNNFESPCFFPRRKNQVSPLQNPGLDLRATPTRWDLKPWVQRLGANLGLHLVVSLLEVPDQPRLRMLYIL